MKNWNKPDPLGSGLSETVPFPTSTTNTYSYTDSDWGDLLTVFNGVTITYDEIGPPVTYYDGTVFEWEGRKTVERNLDVLKDQATV